MKFKIRGQNLEGEIRHFVYDNMSNALSGEDGESFSFPEPSQQLGDKHSGFSKEAPLKKSRDVRVLKIQMGLSCNYSCDYCSQRFVERPAETSKKHIDEFLAKLDNLNLSEEQGLKIEFWGGEPLVYWKTMKPLADAIREKYQWEKPIQFSTITNGSLLTPEICEWLDESGFSVGLSHDGPGQHVRGEDPFDDPVRRQTILDFYARMGRRMSFNAMLNGKNHSRKDIYDWFVAFTGDPEVSLGEGAIVDAYDEGGVANSITTKQDHFDFRQKAFNDIYSTEGKIGFNSIVGKVDEFTAAILNHRSSDYLNQKCGMDDERVLAVDLRGNVITCQNVSAVQVAGNGEAHLSGTLEKFEDVVIKTATHWSNRPDCNACPVLHLCKGSCMYLEDKYWDISCRNAYSDNVSLFALAMEKITGHIPIFIDAPHLPEERQDIFGKVLEHVEKPTKKVFSIKVVTEKVTVEGIEVFGRAGR